MGLLTSGNIKVYEGKWNQIGKAESLDADDINLLKPLAEVVKSTYGLSVRFELKAGGKIFIPLSTTEDYPIGTKVDITLVDIIHLQKEGTTDTIDRIVVRKPQEIINNSIEESFEL